MCVEDTGPGIPAELRRTMFQRGISTKGRSRGTGLLPGAGGGGGLPRRDPGGVGKRRRNVLFISFHREETPDGKE